MPLLIDGHNLIGHLPTLSLQDPDDEEKLFRILASYQARTGKRITVVFDPGTASSLAKSRRYGKIEVVFSPHGSSADSVIARRVRKSRRPSEWIVVTSDAGLAETVAGQGASVRSVDVFAGELSLPAEAAEEWKDAPPSPTEVEEWLALFENQE